MAWFVLPKLSVSGPFTLVQDSVSVLVSPSSATVASRMMPTLVPSRKTIGAVGLVMVTTGVRLVAASAMKIVALLGARMVYAGSGTSEAVTRSVPSTASSLVGETIRAIAVTPQEK